MRTWIVAVALGLCGAVRATAGLPAEVTVSAPARLEVLNAGKPGGTISLRVGEKLSVIEVSGDYVQVRYRNVAGRVLAVHTDLPREEVAAAARAPVAAMPRELSVAPSAIVTAPPVARAPAKYVPGTMLERVLYGRLMAWEQGALRRSAPERLAGVKFFAIYFSASWCGPCRTFTPELIDAYGKIRALYPEFEVVLVNRDSSPAEMMAYVRDARMPWPALAFESIASSREITRYAGDGIPCLVLVDAQGKVLSDSYRGGRYVGPDAVLDDTWKILREYRQKNARPKT